MLLTLISAFSALLSFLAGMKTKGVLWAYMLTSCVYDSFLFSLQLRSGTDWFWTRNFFLPLEYSFISVYYKKEVFDRSMTFNAACATVLVLFLTPVALSPKGWLAFSYPGALALNAYYILLALSGYRMLFREQKSSFLEKSPFFWANTAIAMYAAGGLLLCLLQGIAAHPVMPRVWPYLFLALNILKNILTGIALTRRSGD